MSEAFRADPADLSDAIAALRTIVIDFARLGPAADNGIGTVHTLANSVYTLVVASAMLIPEALGDANRHARSQIADRFVGAIGVFSALGALTHAIETAGAIRTVRMLETASQLAVRISAGVVDRTLSSLLAVPAALTLDARHSFWAGKVAGFRRFATALDASFVFSAL
jgi:hypothetical protein